MEISTAESQLAEVQEALRAVVQFAHNAVSLVHAEGYRWDTQTPVSVIGACKSPNCKEWARLLSLPAVQRSLRP